MNDEQQFSENFEENLRIENEFLKLKLKAQFGDAFKFEGYEGLTPEIENSLLKKAMHYEDEYLNNKQITIYDRLARPAFLPIAQLTAEKLKEAVNNIFQLLEAQEIILKFNHGPYEDEVLYQFLTEEFFLQKVDKRSIPGIQSNFVYEDFKPNHYAAILKQTHAFMLHWFWRSFNESCAEISWNCVTAKGIQLTREDVINKLTMFFESFENFTNDGYNINDINFTLPTPNSIGMGYAEGTLKYDAILENGEVIEYKGAYKLYMQLEENWWSIFSFIMPGCSL
jgi:hypothetical protein